MLKEDDIILNCRQCGKDFVFSKAEQEFYEEKGFELPRRCKECRSPHPTRSNHLNCSQCGITFEEDASVYCNTCLSNTKLESEFKTRIIQEEMEQANSRLQAIESENAELKESLRCEQELVGELKRNVSVLHQDLEKLNQLHLALDQWFQPMLGDIETRMGERLTALEGGQNRINERMLQLIQKIHEMYANATLMDIIKQRLRHNPKQGNQPV